MFQHVHQTEASLGKKLRSLDGLEEYFWLTENTFPRTTMILAEVQGATTVEAWRTHFVKCSSDIRSSPRGFAKSPGERPYFEALPDIQLPLRVMPLEGANLDASIAEGPVLRNRVVREWVGNDVKTPSQPDPPQTIGKRGSAYAMPKFSAILPTPETTGDFEENVPSRPAKAPLSPPLLPRLRRWYGRWAEKRRGLWNDSGHRRFRHRSAEVPGPWPH
jgi:hypothetical protein